MSMAKNHQRQQQPFPTAPQTSEIKSFGSQHGRKNASLRFRHRELHPAQTSLRCQKETDRATGKLLQEDDSQSEAAGTMRNGLS